MGCRISDGRKLWTRGRVPYEINDTDFPAGSANRQIIQDAVDAWNADTIITLYPRGEEDDYAEFVSATQSCSSAVGRQGGAQEIRCNLTRFAAGNIIHEIGHAVGLWHEHTREDRDDNITVHFDNIQDGALSNFSKKTSTGTDVGTYDYGSIMHYGTRGFAVDATQNTITPDGGANIGQRAALSAGDIETIRLTYSPASLVAWADDSDRNGYYQVKVRGLNGGGGVSIPEFTVNSVASGQQIFPDIHAAANGSFVVVWQDDKDKNGYYQIYARGFNANGTERFADITVNTKASGQQRFPVVGTDEDGGFVVAWEDDNDNNGYCQIYARGFNADGTERFAAITVNSKASGQQLSPDVSVDSNGGFVVVWEDDNDNNGHYQIYARGFTANGVERFSDITINSRASGQQLSPAIGMDAKGGFVVVWEDDSDKNGYYQIYARGFAANGTERFADITVNAKPSGQQLWPDVAVAPAGGFVAVWGDDRDKNGYYQIYARGFDASGAERIPEMVVNTDASGQQLLPTVCCTDAGGFVVTWEDDRNKNNLYQIYARGFDLDGDEEFKDRAVNRVSSGQQLWPAITAHRSAPRRRVVVHPSLLSLRRRKWLFAGGVLTSAATRP